MKILIVDRYKENIEMITSILLDSIKCSITGTNELDYKDYDLIIADWKYMDEIDFKKVPTLIVSANDTVEVEVDALDRGAIDFVSKPISPPILIARINKWLEV